MERPDGRFFAIRAMEMDDSLRQVMIDQPEIGWLAFLVRPRGQGVEWLVQAKTEPGNLGETHFAPTVQATRSNYQRIHGGAPTRYFRDLSEAPGFISDAVQSEQGTRFLWKFNRNSVTAVPADFDKGGEDALQWSWIDAATMRDLLGRSLCVNTDARSVIASSEWGLLSPNARLFRSPEMQRSYGPPVVSGGEFEFLMDRIRPLPLHQGSIWTEISFADIEDGTLNEHAFVQNGDALRCYSVSVNGREVETWSQPFIEGTGSTQHTLLMRMSEGRMEFFVRILNEPGFATRREYGPSYQASIETPEFVQRWIDRSQELISIEQSDEGGRFMQLRARYTIALLDARRSRTHHKAGSWVTLSALRYLARQSGATTNELRTLISVLLSTAADEACTL